MADSLKASLARSKTMGGAAHDLSPDARLVKQLEDNQKPTTASLSEPLHPRTSDVDSDDGDSLLDEPQQISDRLQEAVDSLSVALEVPCFSDSPEAPEIASFRRELVSRARKIHELREALAKSCEDRRTRADDHEPGRMRKDLEFEKAQLRTLQKKRADLETEIKTLEARREQCHQDVASVSETLQQLTQHGRGRESTDSVCSNDLSSALTQLLDELVDKEDELKASKSACEAVGEVLASLCDVAARLSSEQEAVRAAWAVERELMVSGQQRAERAAAEQDQLGQQAALTMAKSLLAHCVAARYADRLHQRHCEFQLLVEHNDEVFARCTNELKQRKETLLEESRVHAARVERITRAMRSKVRTIRRAGGAVAAHQMRFRSEFDRGSKRCAETATFLAQERAALTAAQAQLAKQRTVLTDEYKSKSDNLAERERLLKESTEAVRDGRERNAELMRQAQDAQKNSERLRSEAEAKLSLMSKQSAELQTKLLEQSKIVDHSMMLVKTTTDIQLIAQHLVKSVYKSVNGCEIPPLKTTLRPFSPLGETHHEHSKTGRRETSEHVSDEERLKTQLKLGTAHADELLSVVNDLRTVLPSIEQARSQLLSLLSPGSRAPASSTLSSSQSQPQDGLVDNFTKLRNDVAELQRQHQHLTEQNAELETKVKSAQAAGKKFFNEHRELEATKTKLNLELEQLRELRTTADAERQEAHNALSVCKAEVDRWREEGEVASTKLAELKRELAETEKQNAELERSREELKSRVCALVRDKADREEEIRRKMTKLEEIRDKVEALERNFEELTDKVTNSKLEDDIDEQIDAKTAERDQIDAEIKKLMLTKMHLEAEVKNFAAKLQRLRLS